MSVLDGLPNPLHARWATTPDAAGDSAVTLRGTGPADSWLTISGQPLGPDDPGAVRTGVFRRRVLEISPNYADETGAGGEYLLSVQLFVPDPEQQDDCRRWLDEEHSGRQLAVPGTRWYGGYESVDGDFNFLNLWGLDSPDVIETPEWAEARDTPWRDRLLEHGIVRTERSLFRWSQTERKAS